MLTKLDWTDFKSVVTSRSIPINYIEYTNYYSLVTIDNNLEFICELDKNPSDTTDLDDFEANYKTGANRSMSDSNGVALSRVKITQSGWHYQMYGIEVTTSKLASVVNRDTDGSDLGHCTIKFYDSDYIELTAGTQVELDLNCRHTIVEWEPSFDYEIIGGQFRQLSIPGSDIYMNVVAVPDVPEEFGGSVPFVNGINLAFVGNEDSIRTDGRTSKKLVYDNTYHTNKLRFILDHGLLVQHRMCFMLEIFRA